MVTNTPKRKASVLLNSHTGRKMLVLHSVEGFTLLPDWFDGYSRSVFLQCGAKSDARILVGRAAAIVMSDGRAPSWLLVSTTNRRTACRLMKYIQSVKEIVF